MLVNRSAAPGDVVPVLVYSDVGHAADWLCSTFGFVERFRQVHDGQIVALQLAVGHGGLMLTPARVGQEPSNGGTEVLREPRPGELTHKVTVRVDDVDSHHDRCVAAGGRVLIPPTTHPFGERQYSAEDLGGHRWTFTQSVADVSPDQWGATLGAGYPRP